jgi:hypothetical protein
MRKPKRVLAVASGGGHWMQLMRLRPAWDGCAVTYVTTSPGFRAEMLADARTRGQLAPGYLVVPEANRWQKWRLVKQLAGIALAVLRVRPHAVITTGAAPGYFAIRLGRVLGAKTAWVDSIANADELSMSGAKVGPHADLWLTQWKELARSGGPEYRGAVL